MRSLKLQLFCTFPGLVGSGMFSWVGDGRTLGTGVAGDALPRVACDERELFIRMRSRKPSLLLLRVE